MTEAAANPPLDISAPKDQEFSLRLIIYRAKEVPYLDMFSRSNDLYFTCHLTMVIHVDLTQAI